MLIAEESDSLTSPGKGSDVRPCNTIIRTFPQTMTTPGPKIDDTVVIGIDRKALDLRSQSMIDTTL